MPNIYYDDNSIEDYCVEAGVPFSDSIILDLINFKKLFYSLYLVLSLVEKYNFIRLLHFLILF